METDDLLKQMLQAQMQILNMQKESMMEQKENTKVQKENNIILAKLLEQKEPTTTAGQVTNEDWGTIMVIQ
jgi:hypothetical protein